MSCAARVGGGGEGWEAVEPGCLEAEDHIRDKGTCLSLALSAGAISGSQGRRAAREMGSTRYRLNRGEIDQQRALLVEHRDVERV